MGVIEQTFSLPIGDRIGEHIDITDPQRKVELMQVIGRGINTFEKAPSWLVSLFYELQVKK